MKILIIAFVTCLQCYCVADAWFLVTDRTSRYKDSFVLPLTNQTHIAEARRQLTLPPAERSEFTANYVKGADGINRDHLALGAPA